MQGVTNKKQITSPDNMLEMKSDGKQSRGW